MIWDNPPSSCSNICFSLIIFWQKVATISGGPLVHQFLFLKGMSAPSKEGNNKGYLNYSSYTGLIHWFKEGKPCKNDREQLISQLDVLDEPDRPNPFALITDSDVDEADNAVFRIEEDDEIIDVDI